MGEEDWSEYTKETLFESLGQMSKHLESMRAQIQEIGRNDC